MLRYPDFGRPDIEFDNDIRNPEIGVQLQYANKLKDMTVKSLMVGRKKMKIVGHYIN